MSPGERCWAVLPAAGIGSRMGGDLPKQYLEVAGATLLEHSLRSLLACEQVQAIVVPLHPDDHRALSLPVFRDKRVRTTIGAAERGGSVLAGVQALAGLAQEHDWVLVHDAARPCLHPEDAVRLIAAVTSSGVGGILAEPIVDTVKQSAANGRVERTLDRSVLWRAQTPQMFRMGELRAALLAALEAGLAITDEAEAIERAGLPVQLVAGSAANLKVTVPADLELAAWYLRGRGDKGVR